MQMTSAVLEVYGQVVPHVMEEMAVVELVPLAGQTADTIIMKLTTYKNKGQVGPMSQMMWGQAPNLSEAEIETIGKFVQEGFPSK